MKKRDEQHVGYIEIFDRYKTNILNGSLKSGQKIPSIRALAAELGVAKKTVESAYDLLIGEGFLVSRGPKGTFVNEEVIHLAKAGTAKANNKINIEEDAPLEFKNKHFRLGLPGLDIFPHKKWLNLTIESAKAMEISDLDKPHFKGLLGLRQAIANYVHLSRGVPCEASQIYITGGYKESLSLIFLLPEFRENKVVIEEPSYFATKNHFKAAGIHYEWSPVDDQGLNVDHFLKKHEDAGVLVVTPTHQSPTTATMPLSRRQKLLSWALQNKSYIIEDDHDGEFHYSAKPVQALKNLDQSDRVILLGTFSKSIIPSLRLSYVVLPRTLVTKMDPMASALYSGLPVLEQKILQRFISEGHLIRHLKKMRRVYKQRRLAVANALEKVFPARFTLKMREGGLFLVAYFNKEEDDRRVAKAWQSLGLGVLALSDWYEGPKKRSGLLIGFTNVATEADALKLFRTAKGRNY